MDLRATPLPCMQLLGIWVRERIEQMDLRKVKKLIELANFRDNLLAERNLKQNRVQGRNRKGRIQVKRDGTTGVGPYTHQYRQELLARLTDVQDKVGLPLITENEINRIKEIWAEEITDLALLDAGVEI